MSNTKAALKAAKAALDGHQYAAAANEAQKVLDVDPNNYHANVFLGLACDKQNKNDEAERVYEVAAKLKPNDPLVWQGFITLYEKQAGKKIDQYGDAAIHLAQCLMAMDDKERCQTVIDKYVGFAKQHGTRSQYKHALEMMLPTSSLYDYLEGRFPKPDYIYTKVVEITEAEEKERINKEIGERRTRLGAKIGQVTMEVKREVFQGSNLEYLYGCIIDWTSDDDLRRLYEEKALQRAYDTLAVLPPKQKEAKRAQVVKSAEGLVILKHPFALAWMVTLEWKDREVIESYDVGLLREYTELFSSDGLSKVLRAYLSSEISPFPQQIKQSTDDSDEDEMTIMTADDRLLLMSEGAEESPRSVLSQRLMAEYYTFLDEYASAVDSAKKAREQISLEAQVSGLQFRDNLDAVNVILATALIHYQSPRNHPEARSLFENILERKPVNTSALIGLGLILEEEDDYEGATDSLARALKQSTDVKVKAEYAWCKAMTGDHGTSLKELEACLPELEKADVKTKSLRAQTLYRIGMCIWNLDPSKRARKDRAGAYARFLSSLQANLNYAPSYTILGIYYADYAKDKKRSRKCFQKAFELSSSEVEAAERLARAFADQREWDLVEVVAQRVVDSGKIRPPPGSKRKGISWPFAALGVCQLNNQDYAKSIVSFQSALRISPDDYQCWVGLGEGYHNSGRYIAATKAFEQAQKLETSIGGVQAEDTWFCKYMLANVRRELGDYEDATQGYEDVLSMRPTELGVTIALLQTHVESAWCSIELGYFGQAAESAGKAVAVAAVVVKGRPAAFNLWKALGDACAIFSWMQAYLHRFPIEEVRSVLGNDKTVEMFEQMSDIDKVGASSLDQLCPTKQTPVTLEQCIHAAILAHKRLVHTCVHDVHAQAVAWYNLGWTEYRAHSVMGKDSTASPKNNGSVYLKASVRCFKRAIELEAGNSEFWNALAVVTTQLNPKVAQHAFVRSLYLNDKSARVWTNLGALYLLQHDNQLANDAFTRAQSADPEYTHAWLGQGILALLLGEVKESRSLFAHAFEIADASTIVTKRLYASSAFDQSLEQVSPSGTTDILQPLFALHQLKSQITTDYVFEHLQALLCERISASDEAIASLSAVCARMEEEYETSESSLSLARFAQAKADIARACLAAQDFDAAVENAETALDLSADLDSNSEAFNTCHRYRLSAHLTAGLAYHYTGLMDKAITMFRAALEETDGNPDVVCILSQVLWAKGGVEERDVAREQLFNCVEKYPGHAGAIILLGVIAMLDDDQDTAEAVTADLHDLRTRTDLDEQYQLKIGRLLAALAISHPGTETRESVIIGEATTAVMLAPSQPHGWSQLAELSDDAFPTEMVLLTAVGSVPPKGALDAEALGKAFAGSSRPANAQRAVMMAPWVAAGWEGLL
ncbi:Superkiller protein 3 [Xylographa opegraphella]|nr:Superkiller protein 3 [Xylographa opegraphella]